jgi:biopolymer transport protein TolR
MTQGLDVNLPETTAQALRQENQPIVISISKDSKIAIGVDKNAVQVSQAMLLQQLSSNSEEKKKNPIYLQADKDVPYGIVASVMADIKTAGFDKLGMVTKPIEKNQ